MEHEECGDVLDVVEREWLGETILRSTVQCERCNFLFDHLDFQLGLSECPSCFSKELKLVKQKKEIVECLKKCLCNFQKKQLLTK